MNRPVPSECQRENSTDGGRLDHWTEGLCKVHTRTLSEAPKYPARFVALQSSVSIELVLENPLASDEVGSRGVRHKIPGVVLQQGIMFFHHSSSPIGIGRSTTIGLRDGVKRSSVVQCWYLKDTLGPHAHSMLVRGWRHRNCALWKLAAVAPQKEPAAAAGACTPG